ncbi:putative copia-type protein [Senna tora]|uniref:Putative copia-type protein n=1 Tax=Senna tora TaxID=362788 RepID=A0A835CJV3_9FABA|nr:putative copia-type protein [Senna tora]
MSDFAPVSTPMVTGRQFSKLEGSLMKDPSLYRQIVGSLQYLLTTRPDFAYSVNKLSQFMSEPTEEHYQGVK